MASSDQQLAMFLQLYLLRAGQLCSLVTQSTWLFNRYRVALNRSRVDPSAIPLLV